MLLPLRRDQTPVIELLLSKLQFERYSILFRIAFARFSVNRKYRRARSSNRYDCYRYYPKRVEPPVVFRFVGLDGVRIIFVALGLCGRRRKLGQQTCFDVRTVASAHAPLFSEFVDRWLFDDRPSAVIVPERGYFRKSIIFTARASLVGGAAVFGTGRRLRFVSHGIVPERFYNQLLELFFDAVRKIFAAHRTFFMRANAVLGTSCGGSVYRH